MVTTPWEIGDQFTKMLYDAQAKRMQYDIEAQNRIAAAEIARQNADTAYQRQLERDQTLREFRHQENYLANVTYKQTGRRMGRRGYVSADAGLDPNAPQGASTGVGDGTGSNLLSPQGAMRYYTSKGVSPVVAAGIVGQISQESGWDPAVFSGTRRGDRGTAGFAGQWRGSRQENLIRYAQSRGHDTPTPEDQLDFYIEEGKMGTDAGARMALERVQSARTPEEAAQIFMTHYERPNPQYANAKGRMAAARAAYDEFVASGGGGGAAQPSAPILVKSGQRRYGAQPASAPAVEEPPADQGDIASAEPLQPWSDEDFASEGINDWDRGSIPSDMDVVGTQYFSGAQIEMMPQDMRERLLPIGGLSPTETNQYLILQPKAGAKPKDPWGQPINQPHVPPPVAGVQTQATAGIQAPTPQLQAIPTGNKTRRNAQGQLEINVDGQWRTTGG